MGAHTAPPAAGVTVKRYVCVCLCVALSRCAYICHSLYLAAQGHPCVCLICAHVCVRVGERSLTPTVDSGSVTVGTLGCVDEWESRPSCPVVETEY